MSDNDATRSSAATAPPAMADVFGPHVCLDRHEDDTADDHHCLLERGHDGPHRCGEDPAECETEWPNESGSRPEDGAT